MTLDVMLIIANRDKERREREQRERDAGRSLPLYDDDRGQIPEPREKDDASYF